MIETAIEKGMKVLGFSSHAPLPFETKWNLPESNLALYCDTINSLKSEFKNRIDILLGMEIDFITGVTGPNNPLFSNLGLDYRIGSVHFAGRFNNGNYWNGTHWAVDDPNTFARGLSEIWGNDIKKLVCEYYRLVRLMVQTECPDIIGHLDVIKINNGEGIYFSEDDSWYKDEIEKTLEAISKSDAVIEVNTGGIGKGIIKEPYPSGWILEKCFKLNIPVMINSDAHKPENLTSWFESAAQLLLDVGYKELRLPTGDGWRSCPFTSQGVDL
jgi:histidinol-phosphatase (PHP family)